MVRDFPVDFTVSSPVACGGSQGATTTTALPLRLARAQRLASVKVMDGVKCRSPFSSKKAQLPRPRGCLAWLISYSLVSNLILSLRQFVLLCVWL